MTPACCRYTLRVMGIKRVVMLPRRWLDAAGIALVTALAVVGGYVEANLCVPRILSTSCDQAVFVDHATDASVSPDVVSLKIDRFG